ncbi:hypothetical protein MtrunA17_Chr5g0436291 [Medicago truncatula]|uniref:Transmembrane protein n=1 Tax=Medicago truncatula TaxID=3880 RepID=A0A396HUS0_MEDTR|nr:hypothetical protein MtrunA17_Chr5g0436291 [Medicago truncatula]
MEIIIIATLTCYQELIKMGQFHCIIFNLFSIVYCLIGDLLLTDSSRGTHEII